MMRNLIFGILLTIFAVPAFAGFESQKEVSKWFTFYYQAPDPARLPEAIEYMSQAGMLDNNNAISPIFGFVSGVFRENPGDVNKWVKEMESLKEEHLGVVLLGLWYANLPKSKRLAYELLEKHPSLNTQFSFLRSGDPMPIESIPLTQGAWVLDSLWGKFMATGKKEPVERIMAALPWSDVKGNVNKLLVGGAAKWSLTSNTVQHDRVLQICEAALTTQSKEISSKLREVLDVARKERQKGKNGHNQSLQPTSALTRLLG